ncbi:MAG: hypothetical protein ACJ8H8_05000 [Geminicoccaceae bacterium]
MNLNTGRKILAASALLGLGLALGACSDNAGGPLWGVDYAKGVQLPPSDFPGPNNNPPPMPPKTAS